MRHDKFEIFVLIFGALAAVASIAAVYWFLYLLYNLYLHVMAG